jgi:hypothetical protein
MKIAIAIATTGRLQVLSQAIGYMRLQTRAPDGLYVCPASDADIDPACLEGFPCPTFIVRGPRGSASQRNAILRQMNDEDIVVFFDDDFLPEPTFLAELEDLYTRHPDVLVTTGDVVADGIKTGGIGYDEAMRIITALPELPAGELTASFAGYGCNLAVRRQVLQDTGIEFDEKLPLYAWWEDVDFSRRLAAHGRVVKYNRMRGVHQGTSKGRSPGKRVGYSQVINLIYLNQKGSIGAGMACNQIFRNIAANLTGSFRPEPWIDRRGRLVGNLMGLGDAVKGRIDPQRILEM